MLPCILIAILQSMKDSLLLRCTSLLLVGTLTLSPSCFAWGNVGHRMINGLAMTALPKDMPAFLQTPAAVDEVEYLGPEPDRWRSPAEPELRDAQAPEHFLDMEYLKQLGSLPHERLQFEKLALLHELDPAHVGLQPWQTEEVWERLKSAFRDYRELSAAHQSTAAVQQAILFYMGWLGHYVADGSQPLHTTVNYNGWELAANPKHFHREPGIHSLFESTFVGPEGANIARAQVAARMTPVQPVKGDLFDAYMRYLQTTSTYVEPLYLLDNQGAFAGKGNAESRAFVEQRLAAGASMLRDMIYTAWIRSADPVPQHHGHSGV